MNEKSLLTVVRDKMEDNTMKMLYWASTPAERRKKLMPFFWNVLASKGQVYGIAPAIALK